ncbi:MAG: hypothetical protein H7A23_07795 [Leptospiraceae bacterium]|nr:hypothetical protein [Leptospiraceae bacterium]MCP5494445.1 hypothetical protein [Leptospiraceae bacterium]
MKPNKHFIKIVLGILSVIAFLYGCSRDYAEKDFAKNQYLLYALAESGGTTAAQTACLQALYKLNECVSSAYGYNPTDSCGTANIAGTETDYNTLLECAATQILSTSCNLDQNKYQYASQASSGAFASCSSTTTTDGSISGTDSTGATITLAK